MDAFPQIWWNWIPTKRHNKQTNEWKTKNKNKQKTMTNKYDIAQRSNEWFQIANIVKD